MFPLMITNVVDYKTFDDINMLNALKFILNIFRIRIPFLALDNYFHI